MLSDKCDSAVHTPHWRIVSISLTDQVFLFKDYHRSMMSLYFENRARWNTVSEENTTFWRCFI